MNATADPAVRARLEQALAQWRHWRCTPPLPGAPHLEGPLGGGLSNHNFLVQCAGRQFAVRVDGVDPLRHGLNRRAEWRILESAHAVGAAPAPRYFNPDIGALVCDYLPSDPEPAVALPALADLLRRVHALPPRRYRVNLAARIARYEALLARTHGFALPGPLHVELQALLREAARTGGAVLCHNDLLPANLVTSGGQLFAVDWEYAAMGDPWFDIAGAALGQGLAAGEEGELLRHYLGREAEAGERAALQRQRVLCRYIALLWYLVEAPAGALEDVLGEHMPALEAELASSGISRGNW